MTAIKDHIAVIERREPIADRVESSTKLVDQLRIDGVVVGHGQPAILFKLRERADQRRSAVIAEADAACQGSRKYRAVLPRIASVDGLVRSNILVDPQVELVA